MRSIVLDDKFAAAALTGCALEADEIQWREDRGLLLTARAVEDVGGALSDGVEEGLTLRTHVVLQRHASDQMMPCGKCLKNHA